MLINLLKAMTPQPKSKLSWGDEVTVWILMITVVLLWLN